MMDIAEAGLGSGLFIPTPGQWEQEYLSRYYRKEGWFLSRSHDESLASRDLRWAAGSPGFHL